MNRIEKNEDGSFTVHYKSGEEESSIKTGLVMFGTGRKPNTRGIGLEVQSFLIGGRYLLEIHDVFAFLHDIKYYALMAHRRLGSNWMARRASRWTSTPAQTYQASTPLEM